MKNYLASLRTDIWRTSSARYNAARRLKRKELFSTISLALFSVQTIALAVIQKIYAKEFNATGGLDDYATSLSILAGILIIAISLMEWGSRNGSNADALYKNAEELNALQRSINLEINKVEADLVEDWKVAEDMLATYEQIQSRCDINHSPLDDLYFITSHRKSAEFAYKKIQGYEARWVSFVWFLSSIWYYLIFWVISAAAMIPVLSAISLVAPTICTLGFG
jgi:hypothetical protein